MHFPTHIDFYVPVIDNFGDLGFALNLARSLWSTYPDLRIRFFCEDRALFDRMNAGSPIGHVEYLELSIIDSSDAPAPARYIFNFFDRKLPKAYLDRFPYQKSIVNFWYFLLHEGAESLHLTRYMLENGHDSVTYFLPSLLSGTWGIIINPQVQSSIDHLRRMGTDEKRRHIQKSLGFHTPEYAWYQKWISVFVYPETMIDLLPIMEWAPRDTVFLVFTKIPVDHTSEHIIRMPFLMIEDYTKLLDCCDTNIVRGENSLSQSLIVGKPTLWDIYKENNLAHEHKIEDYDIFLRNTLPDLADLTTSYGDIMRQFNQRGQPCSDGFSRFIETYDQYDPIFVFLEKYVAERCDLISHLAHTIRHESK